jgi:hypothetical protein
MIDDNVFLSAVWNLDLSFNSGAPHVREEMARRSCTVCLHCNCWSKEVDRIHKFKTEACLSTPLQSLPFSPGSVLCSTPSLILLETIRRHAEVPTSLQGHYNFRHPVVLSFGFPQWLHSSCPSLYTHTISSISRLPLLATKSGETLPSQHGTRISDKWACYLLDRYTFHILAIVRIRLGVLTLRTGREDGKVREIISRL